MVNLCMKVSIHYMETHDLSSFFSHRTHETLRGISARTRITIRRRGGGWSQYTILQASDLTPIKYSFMRRITRLKYKGGYELWPPERSREVLHQQCATGTQTNTHTYKSNLASTKKKKMKKRLDLFVFIITHLVGRDTHPTINSEQYQPNCILLWLIQNQPTQNQVSATVSTLISLYHGTGV